jgi:hypothetical protein
MATLAATDRLAQSAASTASYDRFAGLCAILTGLSGFVYSIAFVILRSVPLQSVCLVLAGLFGAATLIAVYQRLREAEPSFAMLAVTLSLTGALGSAIHGGYDLANAVNPPASVNLDLPSQVDPRGLLTFGLAGLGLWLTAWLIVRQAGSVHFPRGLGYLGYVTAALLIVVYLARLIVLNPSHPLVVAPALLTGFLVSPAWYLWLGASLWRSART